MICFYELDTKKHNRNTFDCGEEELNRFIRQYAARHRKAGVSKTMVLPDKENSAKICSFYTLSHTEISRKTLPSNIAKKLPRYPVPVLLIAQLAVDINFQGVGYGKITLIHALEQCFKINQHLPSNAVIIDAINESLVSFYQQYGFKYLDIIDGKKRLYISMQTLAQLFKSNS